VLGPDGQFTRLSGDDGLSVHTYFMTNPSLSGQGSGQKKPRRRHPRIDST
jgi:polyphosphate kinase